MKKEKQKRNLAKYSLYIKYREINFCFPYKLVKTKLKWVSILIEIIEKKMNSTISIPLQPDIKVKQEELEARIEDL